MYIKNKLGLGIKKVLELDTNEIVLFKKMRAYSLLVENGIPEDVLKTIRKCMEIRYLVKNENDRIKYYDGTHVIPIKIDELLKIYSTVKDFDELENSVLRSSRLNEPDFVSVYNSLPTYISLTTLDLIKISKIKLNYETSESSIKLDNLSDSLNSCTEEENFMVRKKINFRE